MKKRIQTKGKRRSDSNGTGSNRLVTTSVMLVCGLLLVSGFFFAARQHFSSMDYGMKNSHLRKQIDELQAEKRRLLFAREVSLSPAEIKKAAKKTGMMDSADSTAEVAQVAASTKEKALPETRSESRPLIVKTAAVDPVQTTAAVSYTRPERSIRAIKTTMAAE